MPILGTIASSKLQGFNDVYFGLIMGGYDGSANLSSVIKWGFTSETVGTVADTLTYASSSPSSGVTYKGNRGYKIGGAGTLSAQQYVSKWAYATDTKTDVSTTMTGRGYAAGISNPTTAGYAWAGEGGSPFSYYSNAQKVNYSNDALSIAGSAGANNTNSAAGVNNGSTAGYRLGGDSKVVGKITFSGESFSIISGTFNPGYTSGIINGTTNAFIAGGIDQTNSAYLSSITKFTFSGETLASVSATLSTARSNVAQVSNRAVNGYFIGGNTSASTVTTIQKFTYSGESISTLGTSLVTARRNIGNADNYA